MVFPMFGTAPKQLEWRLEELVIRGRIETIHIAAVLRTARYTEQGPVDLPRLDVT